MADESMDTGEVEIITIPNPIFDTEQLAESMKDEANKLYAAEQYQSALEGYTKVIELCPNTAKYYGNRAACYMMLYQYRNAFIDAKKCVELDPKSVKGYTRVIKCCLILGEIVEAETFLDKRALLDPAIDTANERRELEHVKRYIREAEVAYAAKDYRKVVYCMDRCCDVSTSCPRFKLTKAECLALLGRYQEAQELANDILHQDRTNADATYVRGMCLYYQDNVEQAFMHFQQVLRFAPDHTKALAIYKKAKLLKEKKFNGGLAFKLGRFQEAYDLYSEALKIDPLNKSANTKLHFNKATVAAKLGKLNESISECTEALKLDGGYLKAILRRALCFMELQLYEEAVRDYESACKIDKGFYNRRLLMEAKAALAKSKRKDYYKILGISKTASTDDIKRAYKKRALVHHPDRHANASEAEQKAEEKKFKEIGEAYTILSDPKKRSCYDDGQSYDDINTDADCETFAAFFGGYGKRRGGTTFNGFTM
ncbi:dnaJ homolog subfamily C member 7 isoform X2 [Venturia canescens]|uniref:dnaJ homolog subfamily C member 7 isoform X2 n=1 Tax=Venturia canescens TaxID=32260 RepID=UPI001C9C15E7|nr:dnaJ homolog subfamily C member 7 isoform X2 [Venturia canescens]